MLTPERLREVLAYDPLSGRFTWRITLSNRAKAGSEAGSIGNNGYRSIDINKKAYQAHSLAWLYMTGRWPRALIDHRNLDRSDNRFGNLRPATDSQNSCNAPRRSDNTTGFKGVDLHRQSGKYRARIRLAHKAHHLGLFETAELAHMAYVEASKRLHGEFGRL